MKKIEELGISPYPWEHRQNSGYDQETGEFNTSDSVHDAYGEALTDWWNGETYGEVNPNAEADARLIAAAPKDRISRYARRACGGGGGGEMNDKIVYRDCINWSNNDHCAKTKCNYCTKNCANYRKLEGAEDGK